LKKFVINIAVFVFMAMGISLFQCCTDVPDSLVTNSAPETYLSLFPDSIISPHITRIKITWWGDDPDGLVAGYRFSFDSTNWTFSEENDSTFQLVIVGNDSIFRFWVAAVDDKGNIDPTPATNLYPVYNSPPSVKFNLGTEIPDTSFPVATFSWTGTDPDGDGTIRNYFWALNDTSSWNEISGTTSTITLRQNNGIIPGENNRLYLKAKDVAGIFSPVVKMPDSNKTWYVKPVFGRILLIDDYANTLVDNQQAAQFYTGALDTSAFNQYSILDIKVGGGVNIPKIVNPMFIETLKLFQCVIWYSGRGTTASNNANFDLAQQSLPFFLAFGGKVLFTTGFPNTIEAQGNIINFAPADSVTSYSVPLMPSATQTILIDNNYPVLESGAPVPESMRGLYPRQGASTIYKMPFNPPYDTSKMTICIKNTLTNPNIVFLSVPLNRMNGNGNAVYFFRKVIGADFGIHN
jgi:hypothetical protein